MQFRSRRDRSGLVIRESRIIITQSEDPVLLDLLSVAKERNLITTGYHLPYNPGLVGRARELRQNMPPAEKQLWFKFLRHFKYRFHRQRPVDHYIVDFYCPELRLV